MKESLVGLIEYFVRLDGGDALSKRTLSFPRYHQMGVGRKIMDDASSKGVGDRYLIQQR